MFPVSEFLIYCFVSAYTPGANNLLSMSNAARLGFRRSVRFNMGITAGFLIVMAACTMFCSTLYSALPRVKFFMQVLGAAYMRLENMEVPRGFRGGGRPDGQLLCGYGSAIYEP